jgi:hypothetical protein
MGEVCNMHRGNEKMLSSDVNTVRNIMLQEVDHACSIIIVQYMAYKVSELL